MVRGWDQILQMSADSFLRCHMVHICLGDSETSFICGTTAGAFAAFFDWGEVLSIYLITEVHCAR